jgi:hypothetical protein
LRWASKVFVPSKGFKYGLSPIGLAWGATKTGADDGEDAADAGAEAADAGRTAEAGGCWAWAMGRAKATAMSVIEYAAE